MKLNVILLKPKFWKYNPESRYHLCEFDVYIASHFQARNHCFPQLVELLVECETETQYRNMEEHWLMVSDFNDPPR